MVNRPASAGTIKGGTGTARKHRPDPSSVTGRVYDLLLGGGVVKMNHAFRNPVYAKQHLQSYGLELEGSQVGTRCIGVWDGDQLIPLERVNTVVD